METIGLDLETYYDKEISIKPLGIDGYLRHPQADLYLISLYSENKAGETTLEFAGPIDSPDVPWSRIKGCHAVAHNARFDETAWLVNIEKGVIPKTCLPAKWSCSADLSVYLSAPRSLLGAVNQLLGVTISKAYRGTALAKNWIDFNDSERKEICTAGLQDARYAFLLWKHFNAHWPKCEQELSRINREMGRRGIRVDEFKLDEAIDHMELVLWEAGKTIPWEWGGAVSKTPLSPKNIGLECRKLGIPCPASFAEDSEEAQDWEEKYSETYPWINALKIWRTGNGFLSKLKTIKTRLVDGIYPYTLKYCGAHTGRFSGDGGFNMQNIYRDERFGIHLRHLFIPRPGKKFLILDYNQIEARILLWVVKAEATLALIRKGFSVYEVHAIQTMGWDPEKGRLKKEDPQLYLLAKARVLALGYGCGHLKFQVMAKTLCGLNLELPDCKRIVDDFRLKNRDICRHWQTLHSAMLCATRTPSRTYNLKLASGRVLSYFHVTAAEGMKAQPERGGTAYHYYGGKLCENEIQALGRDVLRDAMIACNTHAPEYPMVLTVHDELVFEVPEDIDEASIATVQSLMTDSSPWAIGLPLEIEGGLTDNYKK